MIPAHAHTRNLDFVRIRALSDVHPQGWSAYRLASQPVGGWSKRVFDLLVAGSALMVMAPFLIIIAALVRLDSPGPALFRQRRAGFRGRIFRIYKFRTMRTDEDSRDVIQAVENDKRVTRVGGFLRRYSIDELPQLINVMRGDMSLVGPRPHAIVHEHEFRRFDTAYTHRRIARPGITGLAQVSGARGPTDQPERIARRIHFDTVYVKRWSVLLDLRILLLTVWTVFRDRAI